ncbi:uncharacterized protein LOC120761150 isoform X1 [Hirundo rustica]|uniref:uncharacterized protein LOC120761150 isoform X1 n=1 Tax=Hirundo rustica TaxID=43150 RepID=UPI001A9450CB|nr:uncharacterized protein LOC120761150 isoform X1 [Hirundo rustica]XP_039938014.1 uncharacterized protein LOC120761150 isoform X1 [Hirundo rustica]
MDSNRDPMFWDGFKQGSWVPGWIQAGIPGSRMDSSRDPVFQDGFKQGSRVPGWIQAGIPGSRMDSNRDPVFQDGFKQGSCVPGWIQAGIPGSRMDSSRDPGFQDGFKQGSRVWQGWIQAGIPGSRMDSSRDPRFQDGFKQGSRVPGWIQAGIPGSRMDSSRDPGFQDGFKQGSRAPGSVGAREWPVLPGAVATSTASVSAPQGGRIQPAPRVWQGLDAGFGISGWVWGSPWDVLGRPEDSKDCARGRAAATEVAPVPHPDLCFPAGFGVPGGNSCWDLLERTPDLTAPRSGARPLHRDPPEPGFAPGRFPCAGIPSPDLGWDLDAPFCPQLGMARPGGCSSQTPWIYCSWHHPAAAGSGTGKFPRDTRGKAALTA